MKMRKKLKILKKSNVEKIIKNLFKAFVAADCSVKMPNLFDNL